MFDAKIFIKRCDVTPKTTNTIAEDIDVWFLVEGYDASRIKVKSNVIIDDFKRIVFDGKDHSYLYQALFRNRQLNPAETIPKDTQSHQPIILKKISKTPSIPVATITTQVKIEIDSILSSVEFVFRMKNFK